jgi:hypothetical protein
MLDSRDEFFLNARNGVIKVGRPICLVLMGMVAASYSFFWFFAPILINPYYVQQGAQNGTIDLKLVKILAGTSAFWLNLVIILLMLLLGVCLWTLKVERRYQNLIREILGETSSES